MRAALIALCLVASAATAEEDEDGAQAREVFFACIEASADEACFDALEAAVPGWCPLMDNRIRTLNGDALFEAAGLEAQTVDVEADCPGIASMSVPQGVSKSAMCHQALGWRALKLSLEGKS